MKNGTIFLQILKKDDLADAYLSIIRKYLSEK